MRTKIVMDLSAGTQIEVPYSLDEEAQADADNVAEQTAPVFENISKNIIWERMTDQEAVAADAALKSQPPKILRIYEGATYVSTGAEEYPLLLNAMTQLFGSQRAAEILAPNF